MDSFESVYADMFKNNNENKSIIDTVNPDVIRQQLLFHIQEFASKLKYPLNEYLSKFIQILLLQNYNISLYLSIPCIDELTCHFCLQFKNNNIDFYAIPKSISDLLVKKSIPDISFYFGSKANPDTNQILNIYFSKPKFNKKELKKLQKEKQQKQKQANSITKPRQQSIQDIWLQYIGYFRQK